MRKIEKRESVVLENEGQQIFGILHTPIERLVECPAVLFCHGLAGHKTGKYRLYVILAEKLARLGIASLRIDFRGSGDSEGDFQEMTLESETSDAMVALEFLRKHPAIDNKRIGLFGRSVGGTVALMTANRSNVSSLATWAPLFDGEQWQERWHSMHAPHVTEEERLASMRVNGQVPGRDFFIQLFSMDMRTLLKPLEHLPMLHIHGEKDQMVAVEHAIRFEKARKIAKGDTLFLRLPESDHDFSHPKEQQQALEQTCHWFRDTL